MQSVIQRIEAKHKKQAVVNVQSGDIVRVHQEIVEGSKKRVQVFEGLVIRVSRKNSLTSSFTVRRAAGSIGVEKSFLIHSPNILKVEVVRRSKVRRNYLSYMRQRTGKSARLSGVDFDKEAVNAVVDKKAQAEEAKIHEEKLESYDPEAAKKEKEEQKAEAEAATAEPQQSEAQKLEDQPVERSEAKGPTTPKNEVK